jgi:hypothetical protein
LVGFDLTGWEVRRTWRGWIATGATFGRTLVREGVTGQKITG